MLGRTVHWDTRSIGRTSGRAATHARTPSAAAAPPLVGDSVEMRAVLRQIEKIGRTVASVLIQGETGSGKELAARAIHWFSDRRDQPFVAVNCGAVPDSLIETELFGHGKGAFTDAGEARAGVVAQAERGTLFLDEIDALSPRAQVALLRFLQDLRYRAVGTATEVASDVRIVAAANQDLHALVEDGQFRKDLLYRLNIFELWIPPLRSRPADIDQLADHFITLFSDRYGLPRKRLHPAALAWLRRHDWPGNVRELENWIHREMLLAEDEVIRSVVRREAEPASHAPLQSTPDHRTAKAHALAEFESSYLARVLAETHGNVTLAARLAGKERRAFGKLMKKYGIDRASFQD